MTLLLEAVSVYPLALMHQRRGSHSNLVRAPYACARANRLAFCDVSAVEAPIHSSTAPSPTGPRSIDLSQSARLLDDDVLTNDRHSLDREHIRPLFSDTRAAPATVVMASTISRPAKRNLVRWNGKSSSTPLTQADADSSRRL